MLKHRHNKKRNIGLLNNFFARYMASAAVEFKFEEYEQANTLWKKYFHKGTELSKELSLFESVINAKLKDRNIAFQMLNEVKKISETQNQEKLDQEKTALLHEINSKLGGQDFFSKEVQNYRTNASIQILLNAWRTHTSTQSFSQLSHLQEKVIDYMVESREELPPIDDSIFNKTQDDVDQLTINVFCEKVDERYSKKLNGKQKEILGLYVFSNKSEFSNKKLTEELSLLRRNVEKNIVRELSDGGNNSSVKTKLHEVKSHLDDPKYDVVNISNETIGFYLAIAGLEHEFTS